jgi:hypothetical protein
MLIYVNITDRQTYRQTHQNYSSESHKKYFKFMLILCKYHRQKLTKLTSIHPVLP